MAMRTLTRRRRIIYAVTVAVWLIACAAYELPPIARYVTEKPWGDAYFTYTWSFQLFGFAISRFPVWLFALIVVLFAERAFIGRSAHQHADT